MHELWSRGLRYRRNVTGIYCKPDIVFSKKKIAVFVDSEFWQGFNWDERKQDFKSNRDFWISKIERNIQRDIEVKSTLDPCNPVCFIHLYGSTLYGKREMDMK
ncbi:MAG: hypothetical protein IKH75_22640 [Ruminococcus sp.]|nr:hypothetical protein [Ruminococcus sp.]